jgi:WD40 repeat protein
VGDAFRLVVSFLLFVAFGYLGLCAFWPHVPCFRCRGSGWLRAPVGAGQRVCPRCGGTRARIRFGRHVYNGLGRFPFGIVLLLLAGAGTILLVDFTRNPPTKAAAAPTTAPTATPADSFSPTAVPTPTPALIPVTLSQELDGHIGPVYSMEFSPKGDILASAGRDGKVRLWDVSDLSDSPDSAEPKSIFPTPGFNGSVRSVAFSPDGVLAAGTADSMRRVRLWDVSHPAAPVRLRTLAGPTNTAYSLAFSKDRRMLAAGSADGAIWLWDVSVPTERRLLGRVPTAHGMVYSVAFSPKGDTLASAGRDGKVRLWDVSGLSDSPDSAKPKLIFSLTGFSGSVPSVAFAPDGVLAAGTADSMRRVRLWDVSDPAAPVRLRTLAGPANTVYSLAFSIDKHMLAAGSADGAIWLWDVSVPAEPRLLRQIPTAHGMVYSVAFSPKGDTLASAGKDGKVRLWAVG